MISEHGFNFDTISSYNYVYAASKFSGFIEQLNKGKINNSWHRIENVDERYSNLFAFQFANNFFDNPDNLLIPENPLNVRKEVLSYIYYNYGCIYALFSYLDEKSQKTMLNIVSPHEKLFLNEYIRIPQQNTCIQDFVL